MTIEDRICPLTPREIETLSKLSTGETAKVVAADMGVSIDTVNRHLHNMFEKTGKRNTTGLVALAIRRGWIK